MPAKDPLSIAGRSARRKAEAALSRLDTITKSKTATKNEKAMARKTAREIQKQVATTYKGHGQLTQKQRNELAQNIAKLDSISVGTKSIRGKFGASNYMMQEQINLASRRYFGEDAKMQQAANPSMFSREEVSVFYRATQAIWEGADDINRAIIKGLRVNNLQEAWNLVMQQPEIQAALEASKNYTPDRSKMSEQARKFYDETEKQDADQTQERYELLIASTIQFKVQRTAAGTVSQIKFGDRLIYGKEAEES